MRLSKLQPFGRGVASILLGLQKAWRGFPLKCRLCCPMASSIKEEEVDPPIDVTYCRLSVYQIPIASNQEVTDGTPTNRTLSSEGGLISNTNQSFSFACDDVFDQIGYLDWYNSVQDQMLVCLTFGGRIDETNTTAKLFSSTYNTADGHLRQDIVGAHTVNNTSFVLGVARKVLGQTTTFDYVDPVTGYAVAGSFYIDANYNQPKRITTSVTLYAPYAYITRESEATES